MATAYNKTSPYYGTGLFRTKFLDVMEWRPITKTANDVLYTVDKVFEYRPDLLANELYGDSKLWWVFAARNPNVLKDPIFDFLTGTTIYLPLKNSLVSDLGI